MLLTAWTVSSTGPRVGLRVSHTSFGGFCFFTGAMHAKVAPTSCFCLSRPYFVQDVHTGRVLVLKRSSLQSHEGRVVYEKEVSIMRSLAHPNIVQVGRAWM